MSDQQYYRLLERIERRLSKPTSLRAHAIIFGLVSTIFGAITAATSPFGLIDSYVYVGIMAWCFLLSAHTVWTYARSGAWHGTREKMIRETLLDFADDYELSADEMVDLHERLSHEVSQNALPIKWVSGTVGAQIGLWFGMFGVAFMLSLVRPIVRESLFPILQGLPMFGTLLLTLGLIASPFLSPRKQNDAAMRSAHLHAVYSEKAAKRKREFNDRLAIDDEGEIVFEEAGQRKRH
jgi:hypothetical protein